MRLVLDTNVVIAAVLGSSAPLRLIELATEGEIDLFTSELLLAELAEVLDRSHIARRLERKNRSAPEVLSLYETLAERVPPAEITLLPSHPYSPPRRSAREDRSANLNFPSLASAGSDNSRTKGRASQAVGVAMRQDAAGMHHASELLQDHSHAP